MVTYLYIALGGAIGSMARAWMANAVTRAMGPYFPWGTILINIVGSFIIGFYGALTTSDARFAAHPDARAFVMIGICGGFTTFSSFSLQTLDLARDGKIGAAFANIGLSVILCLFAVTAGYASAQAINAARVEAPSAAQPQGPAVLALLDSPVTAANLLSSAARLLSFNSGGSIEALAVRNSPVAELMAPDQAITHAEEERLRTREKEWADQLRAATAKWAAKEDAGPISIRFVETEGEIGHVVAHHGRESRTAVVAGSARATRKARDALHAAIFDTGRPVLIAPPEAGANFGRIVAVAWKDDARAPKAVLAAMPILAKAEAVHILRARVEHASVPAILQEHGIAAKAHAVLEGHGPVGAQLLKAANGLGADLIVMGAFAHGEWREAILGGVTRYMLDHSNLPLFMQH